MLSAICAYIDEKTTTFLSPTLPNTGMPPHFYVTADKSTNHRVTNQVTLVCPIVDGIQRGIVLDAAQVYSNSDVTGGAGDDLAKAIFCDLEKHVGLKDKRLFQMQGRVMDGQEEPDDCLSDLRDLAEEIIGELQQRFEIYAELNKTLHKCLDFGNLFTALCGTRVDDGKITVDNRTFSEHGAAEFRQCVTFVSQMLHV